MFQSGPDGYVDDGLVDTMLELRFTPESVVDLGIDLHLFHALEEDDERLEGVEIDLDTRWMVDRPLQVLTGTWIFVSGREQGATVGMYTGIEVRL